MSYPMTQLSSHAFNHDQSSEAEAEYDRLRSLGRQEHDKRASCAAKSHAAYERGDGQAAHELSEEAKRHAQMAEQYNKQASDYIFRQNNAVGRVDADTIDLHGQYVEEAAEIIEARIRYAKQHGQTHLHVIVGKGHHSYDHIDKLKPRVEQVCQELGLQYATEINEGRIYVNLTGGPAEIPQHGSHGHYQQQSQSCSQGQQYSQQGGYPSQQPQQQYVGQQQQGNNQGPDIEAAVEKYLPRLLKKLGCCVVM